MHERIDLQADIPNPDRTADIKIEAAPAAENNADPIKGEDPRPIAPDAPDETPIRLKINRIRLQEIFDKTDAEKTGSLNKTEFLKACRSYTDIADLVDITSTNTTEGCGVPAVDDPAREALTRIHLERVFGTVDATDDTKHDFEALAKFLDDGLAKTPKCIQVSGATGLNADNINGKYLLLPAIFNGCHKWMKIGHPDKLFVVFDGRWYCTPASHMLSNRVGGWMAASKPGQKFPCDVSDWKVWSGTKYEHFPSVTVEKIPKEDPM